MYNRLVISWKFLLRNHYISYRNQVFLTFNIGFNISRVLVFKNNQHYLYFWVEKSFIFFIYKINHSFSCATCFLKLFFLSVNSILCIKLDKFIFDLMYGKIIGLDCANKNIIEYKKFFNLLNECIRKILLPKDGNCTFRLFTNWITINSRKSEVWLMINRKV
jgi:hypothetical protein